MKINFGVINLAYRENAQTHRRADGSLWHRSLDNSKTTYEVAMALEERYHVMQLFVESRRPLIEQLLADAVRHNLVNLTIGGILLHELPFQSVMERLRLEFQQFLNFEEIASMGVQGVPTAAALGGRSRRFKSGFGPRRRPSFIDTGLYFQSFRAWVE